MVQETFLRAWRKRGDFSSGDPAAYRAWLYRIATNACLDALRTKKRRVLPSQLGPGEDPPLPVKPAADLPWLQPYPDHLLEGIAPSEEQPEETIVSRETIEIAFLAAIQLLPPKQRAVLILRDVLGWSAQETAELLDASVASVNSALQRRQGLDAAQPAQPATGLVRPAGEPGRARPAAAVHVRDRAPRHRRLRGAPARGRSRDHAAHPELARRSRGDPLGRRAGRTTRTRSSSSATGSWFRSARTCRRPSPAYLRAPGDTEYRAFALDVLRFEDGQLAEITAFLASGAMEPRQERLGDRHVRRVRTAAHDRDVASAGISPVGGGAAAGR